MKLFKLIGLIALVLFIIVGVFAASMNARHRGAVMSSNERVDVEVLYKNKSRVVYLITVDEEEYLFFQSFSAGSFVKK